MLRLIALACFALSLGSTAVSLGQDNRPRLLVLSDIGGDPDDQQSLVRLLHYANEFEIEGLITTAAGTPGELKQKVTRPELIRELVTVYGQVRENLAQHASGFPPAEELLAKIKTGNPDRGKAAVGEGQDTEGSRWIITIADKVDPRPLCVSIWGGQTDLAQALWRVRADRGADGLARFLSRLRIYDIADQDGIAAWMHEQFWLTSDKPAAPSSDSFYILAGAPPGRDKREGVFRGMYLGGDESLVSREWMETNVRQNHGPLGALYPPRTWTAPNPHAAIKEGDTPSWFYFLPNGLSDASHPGWGGVGGRFQRREDGIYRDAQDSVNGTTDARSTVWRWREAYQNDFQARLDWGVNSEFSKANHAPRAILNGDASRSVLMLKAKPGQEIKLSATASNDPDQNSLSFNWFTYPEAGTYRGEVTLSSASAAETTLIAPRANSPVELHIVLQVTDNGQPALSAFRRAVVTVTP